MRQTCGKTFVSFTAIVLHIYRDVFHIFTTTISGPISAPVFATLTKHELIFCRDLFCLFIATFGAHISVRLASHLSANSM
jgi:membrane-bound metal-dependent hydrolase YbcI (DUF457 family)